MIVVIDIIIFDGNTVLRNYVPFLRLSEDEKNQNRKRPLSSVLEDFYDSLTSSRILAILFDRKNFCKSPKPWAFSSASLEIDECCLTVFDMNHNRNTFKYVLLDRNSCFVFWNDNRSCPPATLDHI